MRMSLLLGAVALVLGAAGCVQQGLYQVKDGSYVAASDWKISDGELNAIREEITKDLVRTGFTHGIPPLWHSRVRPAEAYRNEFIYVFPLLSFHWDKVTIGNIANLRYTYAPITHGVVRDWPWSGDTNLLVLWQNTYAYFATYDDDEIIVYKDYLGSFVWLPITRLFIGPREVVRIRRSSDVVPPAAPKSPSEG